MKNEKRKIDELIGRLSDHIYTCHQSTEVNNESKQPLLFLGAGCSISSGCPSTEKLLDGHESFEDVFKARGSEYLNSFINEFEKARPKEGYQFLAELIKKGYFNLVLTTNFDTCLEKTLSKYMNYNNFQVLARGLIPDNKIHQQLMQPKPNAKILKLHGCYRLQNMISSANELLNLEENLSKYIKEQIEKRGIVVIGYSMNEIRISEFFKNTRYGSRRNDTPINWYINPKKPGCDNTTQTKNTLKQLGIEDDTYITGETAYFDVFFSELAFGIGRLAYSSNKKTELKNEFKSVYKKIEESNRFEVSYPELIKNVPRLIFSISNDDNLFKESSKTWWANNLVFIHDPDMQGGFELLKIAQNECTKLLENINLFIMKIKGRQEIDGIDIERKVIELKKINKIKSSSTKLCPEDNRYILIDSIAFSGNTINKCAEALVKEKGGNIELGVGVLYLPPIFKEKIKNRKMKFDVSRLYIGSNYLYHYILFPWGLTAATEDLDLRDLKNYKDVIEKYIPYKKFAFLQRKWGDIFSIAENETQSSKILTLRPKEMTSKHCHYYRDEVFVVIDERMIFQIFDKYITLHRGNFLRIPAGTDHRLIGLDTQCRILEIAENYTDQIEDIDRFEDKYGRSGYKGDV